MSLMDPKDDAELELLLERLGDDERALLLEEHRQLEKDLLRLADPLPPADFVNRVMAKVAAAPAPAPSGREIAWAALITVTAFAAGVLAFVMSGASFGNLGLGLANLLVQLRQALPALGSAFEAVWRTSALPLASALAVMLVSSVLALKKLGTEARVAR